MSLKRYPNYIPSGLEWLGDVPEGWTCLPLKSVCSYNDETLDDNTAPETEIVYVDISSVEAGRGIVKREEMQFGNAPSRARRRVRDGDTIVSTVRTYLRAVAPIRDPEQTLIASTGFAVVRPSSDLHPGFVGHLLSSAYFIESVVANSVGVSYPAINTSDLVRIPVAVPPLPEQTAIAAFLDRETAKIDALVAEQRRLIEVLTEKRRAVISHAVTKGLNPDAPMKPSGIDWLGDVPEHWEVRKCTQFFASAKGQNGQMLTKEFLAQNSGDYPVYSGQTVNDGVLGYWTDYEFDFGEGGVLFTTTVGAKAMSLSHLFNRFSLSQNCMVIWPKYSELYIRFFFYHLFPLFDLEKDMIPQHMQASFRKEDLYRFRIAVPPRYEQEKIASDLDDLLRRYDELAEVAETAITLLQERRTALISAAVTGKIDVRGVVSQADASCEAKPGTTNTEAGV